MADAIDEVQAAFDVFYKVYPRHMKPRDAFKAWKQVNGDGKLTGEIMDALRVQIRRRTWLVKPWLIPYPATWLRAGSWGDELSPAELVPDQKAKPTCSRCPHPPHAFAACPYCKAVARQNGGEFKCSQVAELKEAR